MYSSWERYEHPERWTSYYYQADLVYSFKPQTCLEVGVGHGFVSHALKTLGISLQTFDVDPELHPDIVGSIEAIPLPDASVDVVLCAEVLEHLPFDRFETCVKEIARVSKKGAVISLPHWGYTLRALWSFPLWKGSWAFKLPFTKEIPPNGVHCWEIGRTGYPPARIRAVLAKYFTIEKEWLSTWMPYHRFYRLSKRG